MWVYLRSVVIIARFPTTDETCNETHGTTYRTTTQVFRSHLSLIGSICSASVWLPCPCNGYQSEHNSTGIVLYCIVFYCILLYCMVLYSIPGTHHSHSWLPPTQVERGEDRRGDTHSPPPLSCFFPLLIDYLHLLFVCTCMCLYLPNVPKSRCIF